MKNNQSPASQRSGKEFGMGSTASSLFRKTFDPVIFPRSATTLHNRLSEVFRAIIRSCWEQETVDKIFSGDIALLKDLELNCYTPFTAVAKMELEVSIDPAGKVLLNIPPFKVTSSFHPAPNTDTAIIRLLAGVFDFKENTCQLTEADDLLIKLNSQTFAGDAITLPFTGADGRVLILAVAVFFVRLNSRNFSVPEDRRYNAGKILEAVAIRNGKIVEFVQHTPKPLSLPVKAINVGKVSWNNQRDG
ncbi:MAG: hypothetical protein K0S09_2930 [Sphingobacteriaceae bacterium]|jgi:hypothetical protein|nr:hypothetical protein [Sphingobacteriaceae bacterium]